MNIFQCNSCGSQVFFENTLCLTCASPLGFDVGKMDMMLADTTYKYCQNQASGVCNWLLPAHSPEHFCISCATNKTIPNLREPDTLQKWKDIEMAKHRVLYSLLKLGLRFSYQTAWKSLNLQFDFLKSTPAKQVLTGHDSGLITLNISEADPVERSRMKESLNEKYRTLIGHFRHELGHFYWDALIATDYQALEKFRQIFGDERYEYSAALDQYYQYGPKASWQENFVSAYASSHPWEDWAETWAHYLHIMDTAETAAANQLIINGSDMTAHTGVYAENDFSGLLKDIIPLFVFANSLNTGMGLPSFYPFQLTAGIAAKLQFIHELCQRQR